MNDLELAERLRALGHSLPLDFSDSQDSQAFQTVSKLFKRAGLEPIMLVYVLCLEEHLGDVIGVMNSRGGQIQSADTNGNSQRVAVMIPFANTFGFSEEMRSLCLGRAQCTFQFSHFIDVTHGDEPPDSEPAATALKAS